MAELVLKDREEISKVVELVHNAETTITVPQFEEFEVRKIVLDTEEFKDLVGVK